MLVCMCANISGAGEMAQFVKGLLHRYDSLVPREKLSMGVGKMAQHLRTLIDPGEDLSSLPSTSWELITICNSSLRESNVLF